MVSPASMPRRRAAEVTPGIEYAERRDALRAQLRQQEMGRIGPALTDARAYEETCGGQNVICEVFYEAAIPGSHSLAVVADAELRWMRFLENDNSFGDKQVGSLRTAIFHAARLRGSHLHTVHVAENHSLAWLDHARVSHGFDMAALRDDPLLRRFVRRAKMPVGHLTSKGQLWHYGELRRVVGFYLNWRKAGFSAEMSQHLVDIMLLARRSHMAEAERVLADETQIPNARPEKSYVTVATDASVRTGYRGAALAVVTADGKQTTEWRASISSIDRAELEAINLAVTLHMRKGVTLEVLTDSRNAIQWIENPQHPHLGVRGRCRALQNLVRTGALKLTWIKAHEGHALNEAADRLAVARRRAENFSVNLETRQVIEQRIIADLLAAKD